VEVPKHGLNVEDILTVERDPHPEHPMSAGVLRPNVYRYWLGPGSHACSMFSDAAISNSTGQETFLSIRAKPSSYPPWGQE
jgi:hypothetical protein